MGEATLQKIARAFQIPISDVYRAAGLLPPVTPKTALLESIDHVISELSEEEQNNVLEYARLRNRISHGKGNNQESIQK